MLIPVLFKLVVITVLVIQESADYCIKTMLRNCKVSRVLPRIVDCAKNDRNVVLRARVLLRMAEEASFFGEEVTPKLKIPFILRAIVEVCNIIATRGARLAAAGVLGVLKKMGKDTPPENGEKTVVAMDGGLYEHYTEYRECLEKTMNELLGEETAASILVQHSNDGSGIGAALLAASNSLYDESKSS